MLQPEFAVLDETDSGPRHRRAADRLRGRERACAATSAASSSSPTTRASSNYVKPDFVHILINGRIVREGGSELADELEDRGYEFVREEVGASGA